MKRSRGNVVKYGRGLNRLVSAHDETSATFLRGWESHQAMQIINVLVTSLTILCNPIVCDWILPENADMQTQWTMQRGGNLDCSRCRGKRRLPLPLWCTRSNCAWGTLVGVEQG